MIESYFEDIRSQILKNIKNANKTIYICMAWFTDSLILDELNKKLKEGVTIEIILLDHSSNKTNNNFLTGIQQLINFKLNLAIFKKLGGEIILIHDVNDFYLHSKFCIIDEATVITGSYNWTFKAIYNIENIVIINDEETSKKFIEEYKRIKFQKSNLIINRSLNNCNYPGCIGKVFKLRVYDFDNRTSQYYENYKDISICLNNPYEHLTLLADSEDWLSSLMQISEEEYYLAEQRFEGEINETTLQRKIDDEFANYLGSSNNFFTTTLQNEIIALASISSELQFDDTEILEFKIIWVHQVLKSHISDVLDASESIIEFIKEH